MRNGDNSRIIRFFFQYAAIMDVRWMKMRSIILNFQQRQFTKGSSKIDTKRRIPESSTTFFSMHIFLLTPRMKITVDVGLFPCAIKKALLNSDSTECTHTGLFLDFFFAYFTMSVFDIFYVEKSDSCVL